MKVSRAHIKYIINKLNDLLNEDLEEYELTAEIFSDKEIRASAKYIIGDKPYAIKANNEKEAITVFSYFNKTRGKAGWGSDSFEIDKYDSLRVYACLYRSQHEYVYPFIAKDDSSDIVVVGGKKFYSHSGDKYEILDFEDVKDQLIQYLNENK